MLQVVSVIQGECVAVVIDSIGGEGQCLVAPMEGEGGGNTVHCMVMQLGASNRGGFVRRAVGPVFTYCITIVVSCRFGRHSV